MELTRKFTDMVEMNSHEVNDTLEISNFLHDIRNKLTILSGHSSKLSKKYGDVDFTVIAMNIARINELVNELYQCSERKRTYDLDSHEIKDFMFRLVAMTEVLSAQFSINIKCSILHSFQPKNEFIKINLKLLRQILENAVDNSLKAKSSVIDIYLLREKNNYIIDFVDNGVGINSHQIGSSISTSVSDSSLVPHGMGTKIMFQNMKKMDARIEWTPRVGSRGTVVKFIFPIINEV